MEELEELKKKIEYEFTCFFLDQMRTSRENIFANSEEITIKKKLTEQLFRFADEVKGDEVRRMLFMDNLLSSLYCYYKTWADRHPEQDMRELVRQWFLFSKSVKRKRVS